MTLFESIYAIRLQEKKDHLIDKANLTPEQKAEIKAFFTKHPNYESKIDWNNLGRLTYKDFEPIMKEAEGAKSAVKARAKTKEGITEEWRFAPEDSFKILKTLPEGKIFVAPLNHEGAQFMQTAYDINSHWCISTEEPKYWNMHIQGGCKFILFYDINKKLKLMIDIHPDALSSYHEDSLEVVLWNTSDEQVISFCMPLDYI